AGARGPVDPRELRFTGHGDRRPDHDADSRSVHRTDRGGNSASTSRARDDAAVSNVALSPTKPGSAPRLDLHLRDNPPARDRLRTWRAGIGGRRFRRLVVAVKDLAVSATG